MTFGPSARDALVATIESQRSGCEMSGSNLYSDVLRFVAADVAASGPLADLLEPVAFAPLGDAAILRLLAGLHLLVLDGRAPSLAVHYPSVGGSPGRALGDAVVETVVEHRDELALRMAQGVQTNEVGRSAVLIGGELELSRLGLPLRILEIGSSAGLNLLADRYRYVGAGGAAFGPPDAALVFDRPWPFAQPDLSLPLAVQDRRGSDIAPIAVGAEEGRLRLRSFVWADQLERMARLDAALAVARVDPPIVDRAPAPSWLREHLGERRIGVTTVVSHSITFQYLAARDRRSVIDVIEAAGRSATRDGPVAWLRLEPGGDQAELRLTTWPGGTTHLLARSSYHGPPVEWLVPEGGFLRASASA